MFSFVRKHSLKTSAVMALALAGSGLGVEAVKANEASEELTLQQIQEYNQTDSMAQVTSVSQLSDVSPTDWAYEALRSLVERYGCIVGYPDSTFRGNRALSRYEFAAGLNACMQQMERLIAASEAVLREDIEKLQRLMSEFEAELAALGARVDNLEGRVAFLEDHQFSTTTKLKGEAIMALTVADGGDGESFDVDGFVEDLEDFDPEDFDLDDIDPEVLSAVIEDLDIDEGDLADLEAALDDLDLEDLDEEDLARAFIENLDLDLRDIARLAAATGITEDRFDEGDRDAQVTLSNRVRLTLDTSFTGKDLLRTRLAAGNVADIDNELGTDMARLNFRQRTGMDLEIDRLYYKTKVGDQTTVWVGSLLPPEDIYETFSPFTSSSGTGSISRFARYNPLIYRTFDGAGGGVKYEFNDTFDITASYLADNGSDPSDGEGLFNGSFTTGVQLGIHPTDSLDVGLAYMYSYQSSDDINLTGSLGGDSDIISGLAELTGTAVSANNLGIQSSWRISEKFNLAGWFGYSFVEAKGFDADVDLLTWSINGSILDLGKEGAVGTIAVGQAPYITSGDVLGLDGDDLDPDPNFIVEGNYKYPVTENITITPGIYAIFNPNNNDNNDTIVVGVLRTVFKF